MSRVSVIETANQDSSSTAFADLKNEVKKLQAAMAAYRAESDAQALILNEKVKALESRVQMVTEKKYQKPSVLPSSALSKTAEQPHRSYLQVVRDCLYKIFCEERDTLINGLTRENFDETVAELLALREKNPIRTTADLKEGNGNRSIVDNLHEAIRSADFDDEDFDRLCLYNDLLVGLVQHKVFRNEINDGYRLKAELDPESSKRYKYYLTEHVKNEEVFEELEEIAAKREAVLAEYEKLETKDSETEDSEVQVSSSQLETENAKPRADIAINKLKIEESKNKTKLQQSGRFFKPSLRTRYYAEAAQACANAERENRTVKQWSK